MGSARRAYHLRTFCRAVIACLSVSWRVAAAAQPDTIVFHEAFGGRKLDPRVWKLTRENDFQESTIDVAGADRASERGGRLRLRAATIGTDDRTVKFHGVRTVDAVVNFGKPTEIAFTLDWNNQTNGCYLTAGVYLCPAATDVNPRGEDDWLKIEYIGVPPGKNGRCLIAACTRRRLRHLFTAGWPKEQRVGRRIGVQHVVLRIDAESFTAMENGRQLLGQTQHGLQFTRAHVYIQMSSHSNYPPREVFFDDIVIRRLGSE